jgi:hypothetical protein
VGKNQVALADVLSPNELEALVADDMLLGADISQKNQAPAVIKPRRTLLEWVRENRPYLAPDRRFDLEGHRYLEGPYTDNAQRQVFMKGGQLGISELLISWILYMAADNKATGLYVLPTDTHVSDFSAARLGQAIDPRVSPKLAALIVSASGGERGADRVGLKRVGDRFVYFRGGKVQPDNRAPQLHSIDADALVLDEVDQMDQRVPSIVRERLGHNPNGHERLASTPTYSEQGIHKAYMESDQRVWQVKCESCGEWQPLELSNLVIEWDKLQRPVVWHGQGAEPFLACRKCKTRLNRSGPGQWIPTYPEREVHGYLIPGLASEHKKLADLLEALRSVDEITRQQAFNQKLGLVYVSSRSKQMTQELLDQCRRSYLLGPRPGKTVMGIDVGRLLHVVIRHRFEGDWQARYIGEIETFEEATRLMQMYGVKACVVDALPETREARKFQKANPGKVWLAYYDRQQTGSKDQSPSDWDDGERTVDLDRTRTLDTMYARFIAAANQEPGATLPAGVRDLPDYYDQMRAPARVLKKAADGNQVPVYVETTPDHYAHAENYCAVASTAPVSDWDDVAGLGHVEEFESRWA